MITILKWSGKAVTENRRLDGRFHANANYKAFLEHMIWIFKVQAAGIRYNYPDILMCVSVNSRVDHHNLHKPILDAIERSGLVDNDKNVGWVRMAPPERHPQGQDDEITVILTGETVKKQKQAKQ